SFAVENLNAGVIAVADVDSPIRRDGDRVRQIELSRPRALLAPRLYELTMTVEFDDSAVAIPIGDINLARLAESDIRGAVELIRTDAGATFGSECHQQLPRLVEFPHQVPVA